MQTTDWPKTGRNELCPCGSGKKFKRCHGSIEPEITTTSTQGPPTELIRQIFAEKQAEIHQQQQQQGLGRPIISAEISGYRVVFVANEPFFSPNWKTFHDFLRDYPVLVFGKPWMAKEMKKPLSERHPYLQWMQRAIDDHKRLATRLGDINTGPMSAAIGSVMSFAYNLYLIRHNLPANPTTDRLWQRLVKRLKNPDHFWGALYETYAFALFAIAGFTIELEDESDRSKTHCEFSARRKGPRTYSIECKGRNRAIAPVNPDGTPRIDDETLGLSRKLKEALSKSARHERVVFIDIDMPNITSIDQMNAVANASVSKLRELESTLQIQGRPAPPAYVFVTNMPDHRNVGDASYGLQASATGFKIPDFGHGAKHHGMHAVMKAREEHADILSLREAAKVRHVIPSTFDGSNPALAFSKDTVARLKIGNWYKVPNAAGAEIEAELCDAIVMEEQKMAYCIYRTKDGAYFPGTSPLTEDEMRAHKLHPQTFFGVVRDKQSGKIETVEETFDFFFKTYRNTSKEKLLEFLVAMPDRDDLAKQSQRDLAITFCERLALHAHKKIGKA